MKIIALILLLTLSDAEAQLKKYSFEEAEALSVRDPKPLVIFVRTNWCKICGLMEHSTFKDPDIVALLNRKFYFIDFYADEKNDIHYNGRTYYYRSTGAGIGTNELAHDLALAHGEIIYPTLVIVDIAQNIAFKKHSFTDSAELMELLLKLRSP